LYCSCISDDDDDNDEPMIKYSTPVYKISQEQDHQFHVENRVVDDALSLSANLPISRSTQQAPSAPLAASGLIYTNHTTGCLLSLSFFAGSGAT
jgi:hypothetical protein